MMNTESFRSAQMEVDERRRVALHRMGFALFAVLGDGPGALLPSLLPGRHIQLDANRYKWIIC